MPPSNSALSCRENAVPIGITGGMLKIKLSGTKPEESLNMATGIKKPKVYIPIPSNIVNNATIAKGARAGIALETTWKDQFRKLLHQLLQLQLHFPQLVLRLLGLYQ